MLSKMGAFIYMRLFMEEYYNKTQSDDIAGLLSDTILIGEGLTADPAAWEDWVDAINHINSDCIVLTHEQAYKAVIKFINDYAERINSEEVLHLIDDMRRKNVAGKYNSIYWDKWCKINSND